MRQVTSRLLLFLCALHPNRFVLAHTIYINLPNLLLKYMLDLIQVHQTVTQKHI